MGFAEDEFYKYLRGRSDIHDKIKVKEMLARMPGVFSDSTVQELHAKVTLEGDRNAVYHFLNNLQMRDDWVNHLLKALWECEKIDLYISLRKKYKDLRPRKPIYSPPGSPPSPSYSLPSPRSNNNEPVQPDSSPRCISLPPPMNPKVPESEPSPSGALSLNQFQPQLKPKEHGSPPMQHKRPTPNAFPSAQHSVTHQTLPPDETDNGTPNDDIIKKPIPESRSLQSPPFVNKAGVLIEAPSPLEQTLPTSYSLPAKKDADDALRFQEKSINHELQGSPRNHPPIFPVNNRQDGHKDLVEPHQQVLPSQAGGSVKGLPDSPVNSRHDVNNAHAGPHQRELPGPQPAAGSPVKLLPDSHANMHHDVNTVHGGPHQRELPGPQPETGSPVKRLPDSHENIHHDVNTARTGLHEHGVPGNQPSSSSCRPLDSGTFFSKPAVLRSIPGAGNVTGEVDETSDLSEFPALEISVTSESPQVSEIAQQPNGRLSQASVKNRNLTPGNKPTTSTLRKSGSPSRRPEENDEPGDYSSLSPEPEEISYRTASGSSSYVLHYREEAPAEDMEANNVPRRRFVTNADAKETSDRMEHSSFTLSDNLENPAVIVLGATVVCLALYIVWLKRKL